MPVDLAAYRQASSAQEKRQSITPP